MRVMPDLRIFRGMHQNAKNTNNLEVLDNRASSICVQQCQCPLLVKKNEERIELYFFHPQVLFR